MKFSGSCIAVYPLHLTDDVLEAIKALQALDYSAEQLTVMGEWLLQDENSPEDQTLKQFTNTGIQEVFWDELSDLLEGKALFKMSESGSLTVAGGLSKTVLSKDNIGVGGENSTQLNSLLQLANIPESSFKHYETTLETGLLILIAFGSHQELEDAGDLLELSRSIDVSLHLSHSN